MTDLQEIYEAYIGEQFGVAAAAVAEAEEKLALMRELVQNGAPPRLDVDKAVFTVRIPDPYDNYYNRHKGTHEGPVYPTRTGRGLVNTFKTVLGDEWHSAYEIKPERVTVTMVTNDIDVPIPADFWLPLVEDARTLAAATD